ncbi:MAG: short-chain dehydorgenase/reductase [Ilumatobacteraceae bacterium]|nr:short-chain dehydorgenase/reductase [Ilumatobacteraceae bacterium]
MTSASPGIGTRGRFEGKVVFITGGGHGQGRMHALRFAEEGADIVVVDVCHPVDSAVPYPMADENELRRTAELVEERGRRCIARPADVRDVDLLRAVADEAVERFGAIDIAVASAGIISFQHFDDITDATWDAVIDVNLKGAWNTARAVVPAMKAGRRGGSIIITSSAAGLRGQMPYCHYVASKHGVVGLAKALANELAPWRIRVNTVHPTGVAMDSTGRESDSLMGTLGAANSDPAIMSDPLFLAGAGNRLPNQANPFDDDSPVPVIEPVDVANAVMFLASDEARYITGAQLPVDAGNTVKP